MNMNERGNIYACQVIPVRCGTCRSHSLSESKIDLFFIVFMKLRTPQQVGLRTNEFNKPFSYLFFFFFVCQKVFPNQTLHAAVRCTWLVLSFLTPWKMCAASNSPSFQQLNKSQRLCISCWLLMHFCFAERVSSGSRERT